MAVSALALPHLLQQLLVSGPAKTAIGSSNPVRLYQGPFCVAFLLDVLVKASVCTIVAVTGLSVWFPIAVPKSPRVASRLIF